ncbi:hypothetical protein FRAAL5432 [Frankia alni ACN14a]|uniref:Uncharacterized protein n=1 Tax=Frankia alni (strain DSM 45986 / CECT 9034 / ACN14a) TaxID=326424 RepID=Q0REP2_FRAAA|nr:hypothetical protein FRAAL5432 [Frankia alni ACN14a]
MRRGVQNFEYQSSVPQCPRD